MSVRNSDICVNNWKIGTWKGVERCKFHCLHCIVTLSVFWMCVLFEVLRLHFVALRVSFFGSRRYTLGGSMSLCIRRRELDTAMEAKRQFSLEALCNLFPCWWWSFKVTKSVLAHSHPQLVRSGISNAWLTDKNLGFSPMSIIWPCFIIHLRFLM